MTLAADIGRLDAVPSSPSHALEIERLSGSDWDAAIADFDDVVQEQLYVFANERWPGTRIEPIVFRRGGEAVGGILVMIQHLPFRVGSLAVCKWGPLLNRSTRADARSLYREMVEALIEEYCERRGLMLSIMPRAMPEAENWRYAYLKHRGFSEGPSFSFPMRYLVKLRLSDDEIRAGFEQKWRYHLRKSEKEGLTFEHAGPERLDDFKPLYAAMNERKKFANYSAFDQIDSLMAVPVEQLRPELFFVRAADGELVAGAIIFKAGDTAVYLYGATNERALPLRAGYLMHFEIIKWLRDNTRAEWYDLGGSDGFQGLHQFKKGMVGAPGQIVPVPPIANYATRPMARLVGNAAFAVRDAAKRAERYLNQMRPDRAKPDQARPE